MTAQPARSPSIPISAWTLVLTLAGVAGHLIYYYPRLPDTVASHFGASGRPDGWSSKETYSVIIIAIAGVLALMFLGIGPFIRRLPNDMINFPNRDYWLAPERRDASLAAFARMVHGIGIATLALLIGINQLVFNANLNPPANLGAAAWVLLGAYLSFVSLWTIRLFRQFRVV